jgi:hypothetical protein
MIVSLLRKPLNGGGILNALPCGGMSIDASRIPMTDNLGGGTVGGLFWAMRDLEGNLRKAIGSGDKGRFPANVILYSLSSILGRFPVMSATVRNPATCVPNGKGMFAGGSYLGNTYGDKGSAARCFKQVGDV